MAFESANLKGAVTQSNALPGILSAQQWPLFLLFSLRMSLLAVVNRVLLLLEAGQGSWRAGSAIKRTRCSRARPWFGSQYLRGYSQPTTHSSSSRDPATALWLFPHQACTWHIYMYVQADTRHIRQVNVKFQVFYHLTNLPVNLFYLKLPTKTLVLFFTTN